jgi:hypothetical protein
MDSDVFLYFTVPVGTDFRNRVYKYDWNGQSLENPVLLLDLPGTGPNHDGGKLMIGPDNFLYAVIATSNFNLLSMRDLSRVYDVNIWGGKASLIPRSPAGTTEVNAINTVVPNPTTVPPVDNVVIPVSPLNLNENQIQMGVMLVAVLLILGILS